MARRRRHSRATQAAPEAPAAAPDRWRPWLAAGTCGLFVVQALVSGDSSTSGNGLFGVMLWIALGTFWALAVVGRPRFPLRFGWVDAAVVFLVGWHTIAAIWASETGSPRAAVNTLWTWIGFGVSFLLARQLLTRRREIRAMLVVMIALAVAISGYAVYQRLVEMPANWEAYAEDPAGVLREAGVFAPLGSPEAVQFEKRLYSFEPTGTFALANSLAGYLAPWLVMAVGIAVAGGLAGRRRLWTSIVAVLAAAAISVSLAWTKSRSAYLAVASGLPLAWWAGHRRRVPGGWKLFAGGLVVAGFLAAAVFSVRSLDERILTQASLSLGYRLQYWRSSLAMIADHPVLGCGPGQFQSAYTAYKLPEASEEIADPHNFLLEVWATAGTPAMLAMLAVLGLYASALFRRRSLEPDGQEEPAEEPDTTPVLLGGAAAGLLLAWPISMAGGVPLSDVVVLLGLPLAAATAAGLFPWIVHGRMPALLPLVGVAVLLVDLLAAGGIGSPGVSGTLWLLLALGLNGVQYGSVRMASQKTGLALLAAAVLLAVACYLTAYGPVLNARWRIERVAEEPAQAKGLLMAAAAADPLAAEPWNLLAGLELYALGQQPSDEKYAEFDQCQREFIRRKPNSAAAAAAAAERYFLAFEQTKQSRPLEEAIELYHRAVSLYPNNATHRANLALALAAVGDGPAARREAARALELDALTPHEDKKLPTKLRDALQRSIIPGE